MRITYQDKRTMPKPLRWKDIKLCTPQEIERANLRELYDDELVLDSESKEHAAEVYERLKKEGYSFKRYNSGSRGEHFHLKVDGLASLDEETRKQYRKNMIEDFGCDTSKQSGVIAWEDKPHLKTFKKKTLIQDYHPDWKNYLRPKYISFKQQERGKSQPDNVIEEIKQKIDFKSLLDEYGYDTNRNPTMCELGHDSAGKSCFSYDLDKGLWYCFHCCKGGDIFNLVMEHDGCSFPMAKEKLAKRGRVDLSQGETEDPILNLQELFKRPIPEIKYLAEGNLIPAQGFVTFGGSQAAGKSMIAMQLAMSVSIGKHFLDRFQTQKGSVLYINEEMGFPTLVNRFNQLRVGYGWMDEDFSDLHISHLNNLKLDTKTKQEWFTQQIEKYSPSLVVLDSAVRLMEGDENSSKDVRKVFDFLKPIIKKREICFLLLHHVSKGNNRSINSLRGSGDFSAAPDVVVMFHKNGVFVNCHVVKHRHMDESRFSIMFENTLEKNLRLKYIEQSPEEQTATGECSKDILEWLDNEEITKFRAKEVVSKMGEEGHSKDTVYKALKKLRFDGTITRPKRGLFIYEPYIRQDKEDNSDNG